MCVVSVIMDQSQRQWGQLQNWPLPVASEMQEIIKRLASIDEKMGAKDCVDKRKEEFLATLDRRIKVLEAFVIEEKQARLRVEETL